MEILLDSGRMTTIPKEAFTDICNMKLLGSGSFGQVYSWEDNETGLQFAIKRIPLVTEQFSNEVEQVKREISIVSKLRHENILRYYGCYKSSESICIALELMEKSLKNELNMLEKEVGLEDNKSLLPCDEIIRYIHALLSGLVFLHHKKIIHRDLRSPNILLSSDDVLKIGDFGISKELDLLSTKACFCTTNVGNMFWNAPEMADDDPESESICDDRVDVWSLGVVILEMVYNIPPFMQHSHMRYMKQLCMRKSPDIPTFVSEDVQKVLTMCFTFEAAKRPRSTDILDFVQTFYIPKRYDIFCSHNWGQNATNHEKVKIINEELIRAGFNTWFDSDPGRMQGNVHSAMSRGIENSKMALVFITKDYQDKVNGKGAKGITDNCYLEFHHIVRKLTQEKMLTAVMEPEMLNDSKWSEVLGITMAGRIFVDMSGDLSDQSYLSEKITELKKHMTCILNDQVQSKTDGTRPRTIGTLNKMNDVDTSGSLNKLSQKTKNGITEMKKLFENALGIEGKQKKEKEMEKEREKVVQTTDTSVSLDEGEEKKEVEKDEQKHNNTQEETERKRLEREREREREMEKEMREREELERTGGYCGCHACGYCYAEHERYKQRWGR